MAVSSARCAFQIQKFVMQQAILVSVNSIRNSRCTSARSIMNTSSLLCNISLSHIPQIQVQDLQEHLKNKTFVIDVREPKELSETGQIPNSVNIPLGNVEQAFQLPSDAFERLYKFSKPAENDTLVLSCRSGKRSLIACAILEKLGYNKVINFSEGWLGWEKLLKEQRENELKQ